MNKAPPVTPELLLNAYARGYFPMAEHRDADVLYWFSPDIRGILPLDRPDAFHIPRSLQKHLRKNPFKVTFNQAFEDVIAACATTHSAKRSGTWINTEIEALYTELYHKGFAHSVECWEVKHPLPDILVGGLYGVALGGAFFGESMFSRRTNASKIALVHLVQHLQKSGFLLLDAQFENEHLTQFGFRGVPKESYLDRLANALNVSPNPPSCFASGSVNKG